MIPKLLPADIILTRSNTWLSKAIRWFGKRKTGEAFVSHAAVALGDIFGEQKIIESLSSVKLNPLSKYEGQRIIIYRPPISDEDRKRIADFLLTKEHKGGYAWLKLPLMALDSMVPGDNYPFTRIFGISHFKVCSQLYVYAFYKLGIKLFHRNWREWSPDGICDFAAANRWPLIYNSIE